MTTTGQEPQLDLLVHRMTWEADGVLGIELTHPDGIPLPAWTPGAHIDVHTGGQIRQYSLCSDPADLTHWRIGILREPASRGGSAHIHTQLRPGQTVRVQGPRNHFELDADDNAGSYLFIAGGIGITPILAMAREAARRAVPWRLVHGGRTRTSMAFGAELTALAELPGGSVEFVPQDEQGHIDLDTLLGDLPADTQVYCCGPEPLLAAVEERCPTARTERFAAPTAAPATERTPASTSSAPAPEPPSRSAPTPRSWTHWKAPESPYPPPAATASAAPARPKSSKAPPTTGTSCSPTARRPPAPR